MAQPPAPRPPREVSPEVVSEILRQGSEQIELRKRELELEKQSQAKSFEYAQAALKAQTEDRDKQRKHDTSQTTKRYVAAIIVLVLVFCFLGYCLYSGKEGFAIDLIKLVGSFSAGGATFYFVGKSKGQRSSEDDSSSPDE
jgi:hypothetical protein